MRSKLLIYGLGLSLLMGAVGCSKVPKDILSEKDMQKVLADMLVAEAMVSGNYKVYQNDTIKLELYESVFRKHKISQAVYDSSLVWYGKHIDVYMKVYDRVIADLGKRVHDLGDVQADAAPSTGRDSVNIWPRRSMLVLEPRSVFNGMAFDIRPESSYPSGSSFVMGIRVWGLKPGMSAYPELRLRAEQRDTVIMVDKTITRDGYYEAVVKTMPTRQVRRVYGSLWMNSVEKQPYKIYVDSLHMMRYNYGTTFEIHSDAPADMQTVTAPDTTSVN